MIHATVVCGDPSTLVSQNRSGALRQLAACSSVWGCKASACPRRHAAAPTASTSCINCNGFTSPVAGMQRRT